MEEFKNNENQTPETDSVNINEALEQPETVEITEVAEEPPKFNLKKEILDWGVSIVVAVLIALIIRTYVFTLVKVDGPSMNPTLNHGDTLYTNRFFYTPRNGDIIIFRPPNSPKTPYVKRVIATAGQTVVVDGQSHTVTVDGKVLNEPYIKEPLLSAGNMEYPCTVPEGYIFVLGDNRNNSRDSRDTSVGLIPLSNVIGKATFRLLPLSDFGSLY
ncbi:MAG: signal peptidase I [Clostridia bacterium]|nr:signal peptidase I [Clostridia bacterium]